jgi:mgtE-like transporter
MYAVPGFLFVGLSADIAATVHGDRGPGSLEMIGVAMLAGCFATTFAVLIGYFGAVASYRLGLDPDNHGIAIVTSSLDFLGALSLILAFIAFGLA